MGLIIGLIIFGIPSAFIAGAKGFQPLRWLIALGLIGLIVVSSMASATAKGITEEEAQLRAEKANKVGATMAWIAVILNAIFFLLILSNV